MGAVATRYIGLLAIASALAFVMVVVSLRRRRRSNSGNYCPTSHDSQLATQCHSQHTTRDL